MPDDPHMTDPHLDDSHLDLGELFSVQVKRVAVELALVDRRGRVIAAWNQELKVNERQRDA